MAEYNGVTLEPLMDGSQDRDYQVEQFIFWGGQGVRQHWLYLQNSVMLRYVLMQHIW